MVERGRGWAMKEGGSVGMMGMGWEGECVDEGVGMKRGGRCHGRGEAMRWARRWRCDAMGDAMGDAMRCHGRCDGPAMPRRMRCDAICHAWGLRLRRLSNCSRFVIPPLRRLPRRHPQAPLPLLRYHTTPSL